jgi:hypothetical protein
MSRQIMKADGTCETCEKYKRPSNKMDAMGNNSYECASDTCNREMRQKLNPDGTCETCPVGWDLSSCGKYCINPVNDEQDLVLAMKPEPPMYTRTSYSSSTLKCNFLQKKVYVNQSGVWACERCPLYMMSNGETGCM